MATTTSSRDKRVSSSSSLRMFCTVWKPMSGRKRPNASSPASAVSFTARAISIRFSGPDVSAAMSHLLDFRPPEDALGQEDQRYGQDREGGDVLVVDREVGR